MSIAIVTDSTSDIPTDVIQEKNIHVVPAVVVVDGQEFLDGQGLSRNEFYQRLPFMKTPPSTASPSSGVFHDLYQSLFDRGATEILSIHVASQLSGIYNAARIAANAFSGQVTVIDSGLLTLGLGFQVIGAADMAAKDGVMVELVAEMQRIRRRTRLIAMIDTLEYLKRSGRVSFLRASLGSMLKVRLFAEVKDGEVLKLEQSRTRGKSLVRLGEILTNLGPLERLALLHSNAEMDARNLFEKYPSALSLTFSPLYINVTTVIGTHIGPNCVGFAALLR